MNIRRIVLAFAVAALVGFALISLAQPPGAAAAAPASQCGSVQPCIPCSDKKPCENPLTICQYTKDTGHGCCIGYAGN